jgi:hypothetical protein
MVQALGKLPTISYHYWLHPTGDTQVTSFDLIWKDQGLDVRVEEDRITAVWLYNEGADGRSRYVGELPYKLSFDDTLDDVDKKVGPLRNSLRAERKENNGMITEVQDFFYRRGNTDIIIEFRRPQGGRQRIHSISLQLLDNE